MTPEEKKQAILNAVETVGGHAIVSIKFNSIPNKFIGTVDYNGTKKSAMWHKTGKHVQYAEFDVKF